MKNAPVGSCVRVFLISPMRAHGHSEISTMLDLLKGYKLIEEFP